MKKLLIIPMLFVCFVSMGQDSPNASYFYDLKNDFSRDALLRIAHVDFNDKMTWDDAVAACARLGPGWRLPTKEELQLLYDNRDYIFRNRDDNNGYWGSDEEGDQAWSFSTWGGSKGYYYPKSGTARIRAVTTLNISNPLPGVIGLSMRVGNFEVAQDDFRTQMNWDEATAACAALGPGWRLPTKDELDILYQKQDKIGGFAFPIQSIDNSINAYWSSSSPVIDFNADSLSGPGAWRQTFSNGHQQYDYQMYTFYVRAIRAF